MKKILMIDDEPEFVDMIKMRLEANDYSVVTAYEGKEGLKLAHTENPDLILLDVMMPEMDGFDVLSRLRGSESTRDVPVVMLTAKGEAKSIFEAQNLGSVDYLIKPCESSDLLAIVKRYA